MNKKNYDEQEIKALLSVKLKSMTDKSLENTVRHIIFSIAKDINWNDVMETMLKEMPEIQAE